MLQEKNVYMEVHTWLTAEPQLCVVVDLKKVKPCEIKSHKPTIARKIL